MRLSLDEVLEPANINEAMMFLQKKHDGAGLDGVKLSELPEYWKANQKNITAALKNGTYEPEIVQNVEIIAASGKRRTISKMSSIDRLILRCYAQKLSENAQRGFSKYSYAFQEGKGTFTAACQAVRYINDGCVWCAEIDLENFFDRIPHAGLMEILWEYLDDISIELISRYLTCRILEDRLVCQKTSGLLQGSPLSPVLSNLYLDRLDHEMEKRGWHFCRFADDINIYTKTLQEASEIYQEMEHILWNEFSLKINEAKSGTFSAGSRRYLGYFFEKKEGQGYIARKFSRENTYYNKWQNSALQQIDREYHLINDGILTRKDYTVLFENEEGKKYLPVETMGSLSIYASVTFSSGFFEYANEKGLKVAIYNKYGNYVGSFTSANHGSTGTTTLRQAKIYNDENERLQIAKMIIIASVHNMRANLRYYQKRRPAETLETGIEEMSNNCARMNECDSIGNLMMLEARNRQMYYSCFNSIIQNEHFQFTKRTKRPPRDALNALISFGNSCLYQRIATEINKRQLDIRIGFLHATNKRSQSLNLDIAEIFKPIIIDRVLFTLINKGMINAVVDFEQVENGGIYLNNVGKRIFLKEYENKLYQKLTVDGQEMTYDSLIRAEVRKVFKYVHNGETYKPYKYV